MVLLLALVAAAMMTCRAEAHGGRMSPRMSDMDGMEYADGDSVRALCVLACKEIVSGRFDEARDLITTAEVRYRNSTVDVATRGLAMSSLARGLLAYETEASPADTYFKRAERLARSVGDKKVEMLGLMCRSRLYLRLQRYVEAAYCARALLARCANGYMPEMRFWARLMLLRTYSAMGIDDAVEDCAADIEREGYYNGHPALSWAYFTSLAVYNLQCGKLMEALAFAEQADTLAARVGSPLMVSWRTSLIMAEVFVAHKRYAEARRRGEFFRENIGSVPPDLADVNFSRFALSLVEARLQLMSGSAETALATIRSLHVPMQLFHCEQFARNYYSIMEDACVACGDYASACQALTASNTLQRYAMASTARMRAKDMEVAFREDTTILRQRLAISSRLEGVSAAKRQVAVWSVAIFATILLAVLIWLLLRIRRGGDARKIRRNEELNEALAAEVEKQTEAFIDRNKLLLRRNADLAAAETYARRLQRGVLPDILQLQAFGMAYAFSVGSSAEITSGCFYWFRRTGDYVLVCCADSDWGGVPGAMLAMVGLTLANDALMRNEYTGSAFEFLSDVERSYVRRLPDKRWRGGLAMSVAVVDLREHCVRVASAGVGVIWRRGGETRVLPGSEGKIGDVQDKRCGEDYVIHYMTDDAIYLYSSGVPAMAGGNDCGLLGEDGLRAMVSRLSCLPAQLHRETMRNELLLWKAGRPMTDDILLLGISLP